MKIAVCVKHVPDAQGDRRFADDLTTDRLGVDSLLSELDEYAVEAGLLLREQLLGEGAEDSSVTVITIGPEGAGDAIRRSLQMGADEGLHVLDPAVHGSDALATAKILAAALRRVAPDLVLTGMASTDAGTSIVPAVVAELLDLPQLTFAESIQVSGGTVRIEREGEEFTEVIEASLPALVSVTDHANTPRYPSFKGIMAAKKKPVTTLGLAELGIAADEVGLAQAWTAVQSVTARPPRAHGEVVTDDGSGGSRLVAFLAGAKLV